jgi:predicted hotdog family 3-hydroxylacyl-ACP dehydratase
MQWINALTDCTATTATATACFSDNDFAVVDGRVLETALVECVAQTVAAALAQRALTASPSSAVTANGMLIGVANFKVASPARAGENLRIEISELKRLGPMLLVAGKISCDDRLVAAGELSLYA